MNRTDWLGLAGLTFTLFGMIYVTGFNDSYLLKGAPNFDIDIHYNNKTIPQFETLSVNNIGNIQAKNVKINLNSHDVLEITNYLCHEGTISNMDTPNPIIQLERMSQNINCKIEFSSSNSGYLYLVTISADDSPGKQKSFDRTVPELIKKQEFELEQFEKWTNLFVSLLVTIGALSGLSLISRNLKKKRLRDKLKEDKNKLEKELIKLNEEYDDLKEEFRNIKTKEISEENRKRHNKLGLKIRQLSNDLSRTKGKLSSDLDIQQSIGEFFMRWWILEQRMLELAETNDIKESQLMGMNRLLRELSKKHILNLGFIEMFEPVRNFRNELAHGVVQPTKKQVIAESEKIKEILQALDNIDAKNNQSE